jgi:hypothetical protein
MNAILSFERRHVVVTIVANRKRHARTRRRLGRELEVLEVLELEHAHVHGHTILHGYVQSHFWHVQSAASSGAPCLGAGAQQPP